MGCFRVTDEEPRDFEAISIYFRVMKGRNNYPSQQKNGIRSRKMAQFDGHSIKFESAEFLQHVGSDAELKQMSALMPTRLEAFDHHMQRRLQLRSRTMCLRMPDNVYKTVNPAITFNLSLEPAYAFSLATFAERAADEHVVNGRVSLKLQDYVLYLESDCARFEICKRRTAGSEDVASLMQPAGIAKFRLALVNMPLLKDNAYMGRVKKPMEEDDGSIRVLAGELDWSDFVWGEQSLIVRMPGGGDELRIAPLKNYKYYANSY